MFDPHDFNRRVSRDRREESNTGESSQEGAADYFHSQNLLETFPDALSTSCSNTATKLLRNASFPFDAVL